MKMHNAKKQTRAFTLIELLIVVAIIAILAAIAVPNFLEAQVRSKVSRVKADMRTLATAIESYTIDWNGVPIGRLESTNWVPTNFGMTGQDARLQAQACLTTPVAYMTSFVYDPFAQMGTIVVGSRPKYSLAEKLFQYDSHPGEKTRQGQNSMPGVYAEATRNGISWAYWSFGPSRLNQPYAGATGRVQEFLAGNPDSGDMIGYPSRAYDPTNGTVSFGFLMRSNKGLY